MQLLRTKRAVRMASSSRSYCSFVRSTFASNTNILRFVLRYKYSSAKLKELKSRQAYDGALNPNFRLKTSEQAKNYQFSIAMQEEPSTEQLLLDVQRLSAEVENLKRPKADLEILLEVILKGSFVYFW